MRKTIQHKQRDLIENLITARRLVLDAARKFPPARSSEPFLGTWSILDLLAHLIGWDVTNIQAVEEILAGNYPTFLRYYDKDWQSYNRRLIQEHIKPSLDELLNEAQASHRQFIALLQALPAEAMVRGKARSEKGRTVSIANLLRAEAADEQEHAAQIAAYIQAAA